MENQGGSVNKPKRVLTPEQKRRILEKRRKARMKKRLMIIVPIAVVVVALIVVLVLNLGGKDDKAAENNGLNIVVSENTQQTPADDVEMTEGVESMPEAQDAPAADAQDTASEGGAAAPAASAAPSVTNPPAAVAAGFDYDTAYKQATQGMSTGPEVTYDYYSSIAADKLTRWTEAKAGYIPVLFEAKTDEKIIAITVDDCFQGNNLMQIVQCANDNGGMLTIFPLGKCLEVSEVAAALRYAYESGHEIGNHTYNHAGMYHYNQERMRQEIWYQQMKVNEILGVNYDQHLFRPKGGDERDDQRVHAYLNQLGYDALAIWTRDGSNSTSSSLVNSLAPGNIYLFHTTNNDLNLLLDFIPKAVQNGYRLVTMSEMFGLGENAVSDLTQTTATEPPQMQAFNIKVPSLRKTSYMRAAAVVQKRLIELGWLEGEADGVYGQSSFVAIGLFQMEAGIEATGTADAETQKVLFSGCAPAATPEKIAALYKKLGKSAPK